MAIELTKPEAQAAVAALQTYFRNELDQELSELRAKLLLDYMMKAFGPFAYNQGVRDAEVYFRAKVEDLSAICYEAPLSSPRKR
jgi:uncharacterized protein (DUF2164 family)